MPVGVGEAPVQLRREGPQLGVGAAGLTWPVGPLGTEPAGEGFGAAWAAGQMWEAHNTGGELVPA